MKKFIAVLIVIVILGSLAIFTIANDFFMFNVIQKDRLRANAQIEEEVSGGFGNGNYYDLKVFAQSDNGTTTDTLEVSIKLLFDENGDECFVINSKETVVAETTTITEINYYYYEGALYTENLTEETKTKTTISFSNAIDNVVPNYDVVFISNVDIDNEFKDFEFTSSLMSNLNPFYLGQKYTYTLMTTETTGFEIAFKFDLFRNYKGIDYIVHFDTATYTTKTDVLSYNKPFTLTMPSNLDSYIVA